MTILYSLTNSLEMGNEIKNILYENNYLTKNCNIYKKNDHV